MNYCSRNKNAKTFAQTVAATITVGPAINDVNWINVMPISALAAICSIFTSVTGLPELKEAEANE